MSSPETVDSGIATLPSRLSLLGSDQVRDFLQQIPHGSILRNLLRPIRPPNKSFRAGSDTTIRYQLSQLANAVCGSGTLGEALARRIYPKLWVLVADRTLGHHWSHPTLLDFNESAIPELLRRTQQDSNPVSREQVRRVLEYAPFELSAQVDAVLALLPTAGEVGFGKSLSRLEDRFTNLEITLTDLSTRLTTLERRAPNPDPGESISSALAALGSRLTEIEDGGDQSVAHELEAIRSEVAALQREFDQARSDTIQQHVAHSGLLSRLALLEGATTDGPNISVPNASEEIKAGRRTTIEPERATADDGEKVGSGPKEIQFPPRDGQSISTPADKREARRRNARAEAALFPTTSVVSKSAEARKRQIDNSDALRDALEQAFHDSGLSRQGAFTAAARVASGLLATRWVTVYGSLATEFGNAVVKAISDVKYLRSSIPVGCIDAIAPQADFRCIAIGGADRAPVEIYAGTFRRRTIARIRGQGRPEDPMVVAICEGGLSSVPLSATLGSLGPVFATDLMRWNASARAPRAYISLLSDALLGMTAAAFPEDELEPAILTLFSDQPLWMTALRRFLAVLQKVDPSDSPTDAAIVLFAAPLIASCFGGQVPADIASASQTAGVERHVGALRR